MSDDIVMTAAVDCLRQLKAAADEIEEKYGACGEVMVARGLRLQIAHLLLGFLNSRTPDHDLAMAVIDEVGA